MKYNLNDISIIIPTYNRPEEIKHMLDILPRTIKEIIIVDQSDTPININSNGIIKYYHRKIPSITMARNFGVSKSKGKIICFLDDDVSVQDNYFETIMDKFNNNPEILGIAGYRPSDITKKEYYIDLITRGLFFLRKYDKETCRVKCPYNNTYPFKLKKDIYSQWFPGFNTAYKKEIFSEKKFDENLLGYTIAEDIDFSYSLYLSNPKALLITPDTIVYHHHSKIGRLDIKKISYINQIDHFYFYWKYEKSFSKLKHYWCLFGIFLLRTIKMLDFKRKSFIKWYYFCNSLIYCLKNKNKIKKGYVREWIKN